MHWLWIAGCQQPLWLQNRRNKTRGMPVKGRREDSRRRRLELRAKVRDGINPLSETLPAPIKQKRITSQTLPFPQGWLAPLSTARYLLPLSPFSLASWSTCFETVGWDNDAVPLISTQTWKGLKGQKGTARLEILPQGCTTLLGATPTQPGSSSGQMTVVDSVWACWD